MPFIGTQPDVGGYSVLDALTASATASYTLQKDSVNFSPSSANQLLVSLNGVIQKPGSSFTLSGSTLTFSSALTSSDSIDFIMAMGEPLLVGTPSDATVTGSKLASNIAITTSGNVSSSGNIATTGSGTMTSAGLITGAAGLTLSNGDVTVASGHGINFAATSGSSGTDTSELLDDYEEGEFTPNPVGDSSAGTYSNSYRRGRYVKIGTMVYVSGVIYGSISGSSGAARVEGLPYTKVNDDTGLITVQWNNMPFNSLGVEDHHLIGLISSNYIHFRANDRRVNEAYTQAVWANGNISYLRFSGCYRNT